MYNSTVFNVDMTVIQLERKKGVVIASLYLTKIEVLSVLKSAKSD